MWMSRETDLGREVCGVRVSEWRKSHMFTVEKSPKPCGQTSTSKPGTKRVIGLDETKRGGSKRVDHLIDKVNYIQVPVEMFLSLQTATQRKR